MGKATFLEMELTNGTKVKLTLTYGILYQLRQKKPEFYEKYNKIAMDGMKDEFDFITYLYAAYLCANIDRLDTCMTEEEFIRMAPPSHMEVFILVNKLKVGDYEKK